MKSRYHTIRQEETRNGQPYSRPYMEGRKTQGRRREGKGPGAREEHRVTNFFDALRESFSPVRKGLVDAVEEGGIVCFGFALGKLGKYLLGYCVQHYTNHRNERESARSSGN